MRSLDDKVPWKEGALGERMTGWLSLHVGPVRSEEVKWQNEGGAHSGGSLWGCGLLRSG